MFQISYIKRVFLGFIVTLAFYNSCLCQTVYNIKEREFYDTIVSTICSNCIVERTLKNDSGDIIGVKNHYLNKEGKIDSIVYKEGLSFFSHDKYIYVEDTTHVFRDGEIRASFTNNSEGDSIKIKYRDGEPIVIRTTVFKRREIKKVKFHDFNTGKLRKEIRFVKCFNGKRIEKVKSYDEEKTVKRKWIYKITDNSFTVYNHDGSVRQSFVFLNGNIIRYFWYSNAVEYYYFEDDVLKSIYSYKNGELNGVHEYKVIKRS